MDISFDLQTIRVFLHVLGVSVWVGGQIVMAALVPALKSFNTDTEGLTPQKAAARAFQSVAWGGFALAFLTGIWNILEVDMKNATTSYNMVFGFKFLLVLISGAAAFAHSKTSKPSLKGITGALGLLAALLAMVLGFAMSSH